MKKGIKVTNVKRKLEKGRFCLMKLPVMNTLVGVIESIWPVSVPV
jgi:hypothetical protein